MPHLNQQSGPPLHERSTASLWTWLLAFPVLGGVFIGVVGRYAWQRADELTAGQWLSVAFTVVLGLFVIAMPPSIALRELKRRRLERDDEQDSSSP